MNRIETRKGLARIPANVVKACAVWARPDQRRDTPGIFGQTKSDRFTPVACMFNFYL